MMVANLRLAGLAAAASLLRSAWGFRPHHHVGSRCEGGRSHEGRGPSSRFSAPARRRPRSSSRRHYSLPSLPSGATTTSSRRRSVGPSSPSMMSSSYDTSSESRAAAESSQEVARAGAPKYPPVVLIGGSGFLGSEIRRQLDERGVGYVATSTGKRRGGEGDGKFVPLDLTSADAEEQFYQLINTSVEDADGGVNKVAVISAMGAIGTSEDEEVNSALVRAIRASHRANSNASDGREKLVERFVMIGNTERVRRLARNVPFLQGYASGKDEAESALRECFGSQGCIIKPSFIYGGDDISLQPPRLPKSLGGLASEVLGLYPIQALADGLPDALALPLAPPVSVEMVASAAINVALGIVEGYADELEGEAISMAGSVRGWKEKERYESWVKGELEKEGLAYDGSGREACSVEAMEAIDEGRRWERIEFLKDELLRGDSSGGGSDDNCDIVIMEELECLRPLSMKPAYDPGLNGRWNFVLSKDDLGTQLIKELLPPEYYSFGDSKAGDQDDKSETLMPLRALLGSLYQLEGLYMRISDEQSRVEIVLASKVCFGRIPIDIVFSTSLLSTNYDEETEGTLFLEKFESVSVGGVSLPLPESWQRFRYLEITFLDDEILIARGSGGEPHVLVRANE